MLSATRRKLFESLEREVGTTLRLSSLGGGWPARAQVQLVGQTPRPISLHLSLISSMARPPGDELRFQNPGQNHPIRAANGDLPILVGITIAGSPIVVGADATQRLGRNTRFSVRFPAILVNEARDHGWAEFISNSGERLVAFHPSLFSIFVESVALSSHVDADRMADVLFGSGLLDDGDAPSQERARRATSTLVRDARFSADVRSAYDDRCALCGLDLGLVSAAHVYPASAPSSPDKVWNGILLCDNHHRAFDAHILFIDPIDKRVQFHPKVMVQSRQDSSVSAFVNGTGSHLFLPQEPTQQPRSEMFNKRYEYWISKYEWAA